MRSPEEGIIAYKQPSTQHLQTHLSNADISLCWRCDKREVVAVSTAVLGDQVILVDAPIPVQQATLQGLPYKPRRTALPLFELRNLPRGWVGRTCVMKPEEDIRCKNSSCGTAILQKAGSLVWIVKLPVGNEVRVVLQALGLAHVCQDVLLRPCRLPEPDLPGANQPSQSKKQAV